MDFLLNLIPGGQLTVLVGLFTVIVGFFARFIYLLRKSGADAQKVKQADAFEEHLKEIERAANARPVGDVSSDPRNRDNRK